MARIAAGLALIAVCVALFFLVTRGLDAIDDDDDEATKKERNARTEQVEQQGGNADTYTVLAGDTLSGIAAKTDVPLAKLQRLNPDLDAETLNAGQVLQLR